MPALDRYHELVRTALEKDGWTITDDPLQLSIGKRTLSVDLGAERALIGAERDQQRIAVEIKTFGGASPVADLQQALGQFVMYKSLLAEAQSDRILYLAVSEEARDAILGEELGQLMLREYIDHLVYFSVEREEIVEWSP
jgi:hypothetical protein